MLKETYYFTCLFTALSATVVQPGFQEVMLDVIFSVDNSFLFPTVKQFSRMVNNWWSYLFGTTIFFWNTVYFGVSNKSCGCWQHWLVSSGLLSISLQWLLSIFHHWWSDLRVLLRNQNCRQSRCYSLIRVHPPYVIIMFYCVLFTERKHYVDISSIMCAWRASMTFSDKKLIRRWDSERELSLRRHRTRTTKYNRLVHKFHHGYVLERMFTKFSEITQYNGHYAIQGHSRSPILVLIEGSYTTSY